ncbi:hypothetical protein [Phenylobacterium deserti]|uniref:Uncharacterized protein n=1 Tax=Phenylobacterium deserti TaxID=1914756 RepID=A0A328ADG9_9CAUL|nr:hypothetical protein [Phenylobacterium deserti]RAK51454.1 hypothetical protein DJ018_16085 [Phenylobacterium deserti]
MSDDRDIYRINAATSARAAAEARTQSARELHREEEELWLALAERSDAIDGFAKSAIAALDTDD